MSKSYNNIVPILSSEKDLKKSIMTIVTNSQEPGEKKDCKDNTLFSIYSSFDTDTQIEDMKNNTTRFLIMANKKQDLDFSKNAKFMTTIVFQVRNIPAALYKAMGGFARNNVNMVKLESYMVSGSFTSTQFYADIEGHPDEEKVKRALDELIFFTSMFKILGVYECHEFRKFNS